MTVSGCVFECVFACVRVEATATAVRMDVAEERVWTLLFFCVIAVTVMVFVGCGWVFFSVFCCC